MGSLAIATLVGHLTRDAELKYTNSGQAICSFSVATNTRTKKDDQFVDEPNYWDIDLWGKRAESINQYLTKGKLIAVSGEMRQDKWEKDGQQRMKVRITANSVEFVGSGGGGDSRPGTPGGSGNGESRPAYGAQSSGESRGQGRQDYGNQGGGDRQGPPPRQTSPNPPREAQRPAERGPGGDDFTDDIPF